MDTTEIKIENDLRVLYQDEYLVAVFKPSGLLVHRSKLDARETQFALQQARDLVGQRLYPLHRLDKPTSGVLLFATSSEIASLMMHQFEQHRVEKTYLAIVRGYLKEAGALNYPLKEKLDPIADKKAKKDKDAQEAITHYQPLCHWELDYPVGRYSSARYSLIKLNPKTGRKHQLRRHMSHLRHPILGDVNHGDNKHNKFIKTEFGFPGLALCAKTLSFEHPITHNPLLVSCHPDQRFSDLLMKWGTTVPQIEEFWSI